MSSRSDGQQARRQLLIPKLTVTAKGIILLSDILIILGMLLGTGTIGKAAPQASQQAPLTQSQGCSAIKWDQVEKWPREQSTPYLAVVSPSNIWAVGSNPMGNNRAQTVTRHWNGSSWTLVPSPNPSPEYSSLSHVAATANRAWATGAKGDATGVNQVFTLYWNGTDWQVVPVPHKGDFVNVRSVTAISDEEAWIAGIYLDKNGPPSQKSGTFVDRWDGSAWQPMSSPSGIAGIKAIGPGNLWAVGSQYTVGQSSRSMPFIVHWDGSSWAIIPSVPGSLDDSALYTLADVGVNDIWATGQQWKQKPRDDGTTEYYGYEILLEHWDGNRWSVVPAPSVDGYDSNLGHLVGIGHNDVWAVGSASPRQQGQPFLDIFLHWDGSKWKVETQPKLPDYPDSGITWLDAATDGTLWAVAHVGRGATYTGQVFLRGTCSQVIPTNTDTPTPASTPTSIPTVQLPGDATHTFPETGQTVAGVFLDYWNVNGALAQQGFPISARLGEVSELNGKPYTVQYFERAVFEYHPENQAPYDVLLSQLGTFQYKNKFPNGAPNQQVNNSAGSILFSQTGHRVGGKFLDYWQSHGGLAQQGYPISEEFVEKSDLNGRTYLVQYFERAVFEYHPENVAPNDVLLSQLGTFRYKQKYGKASAP